MTSLFRIPPPMDDHTRTRCDSLIKLMESACSEMLLAPDWSLNMQIVDELNREQDPVVLTEVIRILRKKLGSNNTRILSMSLTLAETLVKNCGTPVHREVASDRFMAAMAKIARTHSFKSSRDSMAIADQSLDIIQGWGEAFLPRRREFPLFADTYHELRAEGLPFSEQYQSDRPPVLDPGSGSLLDQPSAEPGGREGGHPPPQPPHPNPPHPHHANPQHARPPASASGSASSSAGRSGGGERGGRAKRVEERGVEMTAPASALSAAPAVARRVKTELSGSEKEVVATASSCTEMLDQVVRAAESRAEVRDSDITKDVVDQLKQVSPKLMSIIEAHGEDDPALLEELFKVNDEVDNVLRLYKDVVEGLIAVPVQRPSRFSADIGAMSNGMSGMSLKQAAGVKAAASKFKGSIPTLSRPPPASKGGEKAASQPPQPSSLSSSPPPPSSSSSPPEASSGVDLLSGFGPAANEGGDAGGVRKGGTDGAPGAAPNPATVAADIFADFATPAVGAPAPGAAEVAPAAAPDAAAVADAAYPGADAPSSAPGAPPASGEVSQEIQVQVPQPTSAPVGGHAPAAPGASALALAAPHASSAEKARTILDNLDALYAAGSVAPVGPPGTEFHGQTGVDNGAVVARTPPEPSPFDSINPLGAMKANQEVQYGAATAGVTYQNPSTGMGAGYVLTGQQQQPGQYPSQGYYPQDPQQPQQYQQQQLQLRQQQLQQQQLQLQQQHLQQQQQLQLQQRQLQQQQQQLQHPQPQQPQQYQ